MRVVLAAMAATVTQVTDVTANVTPVISMRSSAVMPMQPAPGGIHPGEAGHDHLRLTEFGHRGLGG